VEVEEIEMRSTVAGPVDFVFHLILEHGLCAEGAGCPNPWTAPHAVGPVKGNSFSRDGLASKVAEVFLGKHMETPRQWLR
jgi:hypothetical protein